MTDINNTLNEREKSYGSFAKQAQLSQDFKAVAHQSEKWQSLTHDKKEAIDMILHKIARALNGNADYSDNWHDIEGYALLAKRDLEKKIADINRL